MRILLPLAALLLAVPAVAQTPPPAPAPTPTQTQKPATQKPPTEKQRPPATSAASSRALVLTVQVTNTFGQVQDGVKATVSGPVAREGATDPGGLVRFSGMRAGDYRVKLEKQGLITLERDVTIKPGQSLAVDVTMDDAPPPPPPPPAPTPTVAPKGTPGEPRTLDLSSFIEKNLIAREPMKQTPIGCSGVMQAVLLQIRDPLQEQTDDQLDQSLYVVAGRGTLRLGGRETQLEPSGFAVVPRGTAFALTRRGNTPLIVLVTRVNQPCAGGGGGGK
jgi:mannose-6-phosphate isomerase-like protein (cupin superfamily)